MKKKKTNAQKYSREFEKFVLTYLKDKFQIEDNNFAKLTPPSGDGGYDGVVYWISDMSSKKIQETIFEAKLRSALGHALSMNEFSKALIIAVNRFSDEVYIATNITFSPETIYQLRFYSKRTGINIKTLNGRELYEWYKEFSLDKKEKFDTAFIGFLSESAKKIPDCDFNCLTSPDKKTICIPYIYNSIKKAINELWDIISFYLYGIIIIEGNRGCGKSTVAIKLQSKLEKHNYYVTEINLANIDTSRAIFLELLYTIWGIKPESIIGCTNEEFEMIFSKIGDDEISKDELKCLNTIFSQSKDEYIIHYDIYQYYLIDFVDKLFGYYSIKNDYCIHIHNIEVGHYESCNFIVKLISKLQRYNILFLVEFRNDYTGEFNIGMPQLAEIYNKIATLPKLIKEYKIKNLSQFEKEQYILRALPQMTQAQIKNISRNLPDNPLIINSALEILSPKLIQGLMLDVELENELEYFKRNYDNIIINQQIQGKIKTGGFERLAMPLGILSLLNGKCNVNCILDIIEYDKQQLVHDLNNIGIFYVNKDMINIKHEIYLNSLKNYNAYISISLLHELAAKMLANINIFYKDVLPKEMLKLNLLYILEENEMYIELCGKVATMLLNQGDIQQALIIYETGYKICNKIQQNSIKFVLLKLDIMKNLLYFYANSMSKSDYDKELLFCDFKGILLYNKDILKHNCSYIDAYLNLLIYQMKELHKSLNHTECLKYAYYARRIARKFNIYQRYPKTMEKILFFKSISIKHLSGMHACMQSFKNDINKNPNLPVLMYSYNTHKAVFFTTKDPNRALMYFKLNEKYYSKLSMADQLHNRVNIANMLFLQKKPDSAFEHAQIIINDALVYDVKRELGRIYNLVGNYYVYTDKRKQGIEYYKKAIKILDKISFKIDLWPILINLSSTYIDDSDYMNAYLILKQAIEIIEKRKEELDVNINQTANSGAKLYIGVIVTLHNLYIISPHINKATMCYDNFLEDMQVYIHSDIKTISTCQDEYKRFFKNSVYEYNNNILLKV